MSKKALLTGLLPFISNPVVLTVVAVTATGFMVADMLSDDKKYAKPSNDKGTAPNGSKPWRDVFKQPSDKPLNGDLPTVGETAKKAENSGKTALSPTVETTPQEPKRTKLDELFETTPPSPVEPTEQPSEQTDEEAAKKEMIRKAMSELGKRSAKARAKKSTPKTIPE